MYVHDVKGHTKVKSHERSSWKMGPKCKITLIWEVEVWLKPSLVFWYYIGTSTCKCGQRSWVKVKGRVRSICKIAWKWKILNPSHTYGSMRTMWPQQVWDYGQVSICIVYKLRRQAALVTRSEDCEVFLLHALHTWVNSSKLLVFSFVKSSKKKKIRAR